MKPRNLALALGVTVAVLGIGVWRHSPAPVTPPTILSFGVGQTFEEVVKASTYPVMEHSSKPSEETRYAGITSVTEPAVILRFSDPQHGFALPPTKFALIGYSDNLVETIATSPMLEKLPFDQAVAILENLQEQFKAGGWEPSQLDGSTWFDLTPDGKKRLYERMLQPGFSQEASLRVPNKYGMTFRLWCSDGCMEGRPPYLFLIDIGVSRDIEGGLNVSRRTSPENPR